MKIKIFLFLLSVFIILFLYNNYKYRPDDVDKSEYV